MYYHRGARGKDKDRSGVKEDVVGDVANTLSQWLVAVAVAVEGGTVAVDRAGRGGETTTTIMGARRAI